MYRSQPEGSSNDIFAHQGPYSIVYGNESLAFNHFQSVSYRLKSCHSSFLQLDRFRKIEFPAEGIPKGEIAFRKNKDDCYFFRIAVECFDGMEDNGLAIQLNELLWQGALNPGAFAACYDKCIFFK